jgi:HEAT repeats
MKTLFATSIVVLQCCLNATGQVTTSISLSKTEFLVGEPIRLETILTNSGTKSVRIFRNDLNSECTPYTISLLNLKNQSEQSSRIIHTGVHAYSCLGSWLDLKKGQQLKERIYINRRLQPGMYSIHVERWGETNAESNFIVQISRSDNPADVTRALAPYISAVQSPDWRIRRDAAAALSVGSAPQLEETLEAMLKDPRSQREAVAGLGRLNLAASRRALFEFVSQRSGGLWTRIDAIQRLAASGDQAYVDPLFQLAKIGQEDFGPLIRAASHLGGAPMLERLSGYLRSENVQVRRDAAAAVGDTNSVSALQVLAGLLGSDPDELVRWRAAYSLAQLTDASPYNDGILVSASDAGEDYPFWSSFLSDHQGTVEIHPLPWMAEPFFIGLQLN